MLAFTQPALVSKDELIASLEAHRAADRFAQGRYWEEGRGCAVGCSLVDFGVKPSDHGQYEPLFGIPRILARLEDGIFEGLPIDRAKEWPLRFDAAAAAYAAAAYAGRGLSPREREGVRHHVRIAQADRLIKLLEAA